MASKSVRIMLSNVRCTYPKLFVAEEFMGKKNYSVGLLIPEDSPLIDKIEAAARESIAAQYPGKVDAMLKRFKGSRQTWPIRSLDDGGYLISPKRKEEQGAPLVLDQRKNLISADSGKIYGGVWLNVSVDVFCYSKNGGGVTCYLNGVQLVKEDAPLSGGATAASCKDDFGELSMPEAPDDNSDLL